MLTTLLESNGRTSRRTGGMAVSTVLHAAVIGLAVYATAWTAQPAERRAPHKPPIIFSAPPESPRTNPPKHSSGTPETSQPAPPLPAPEQTILQPIEIPDGITPSTDPTPLVDVRREFGVRANPGGTTGTPHTSLSSGDGVFAANMVEKPVLALRGNPEPRYPATLRSAGIEGTVVLRFVVDTTGRVEVGSIRAVSSDHAQFEQSAREAMLRARFVPAELGNHPVRQLVEQAFQFKMAER
jgi:protein TonB